MDFYTCLVQETGVLFPNERIVSIDGRHRLNYTNNRVDSIFVQKTSFFLRGFSAFFLNIIRYEVTGTTVKEISREDFKEFKKLKALELTGNQITEIPGDAFLDLKKLEFIDLRSNQLIALPDNLLFNQPFLRELILGYNKLQSLSWTMVEKNTQLSRIFINQNDLKMISPNLITKFHNLKNDFAVEYPCRVSFDDSNFTESINKFCNRNCANIIENKSKFEVMARGCSVNLFRLRQESNFLKKLEKTCIIE